MLPFSKPFSPSHKSPSFSSNDQNPNPSSSIRLRFPKSPPTSSSSMQRQQQNPKTAKKNPAVKPKSKSKSKSKNSPPIVLHSISDDDDVRSSVCSNGSYHHHLAAEEEELRLRGELEVEIERELEQELIDGISALVCRLSELKARQIVRGLGKLSGGGLTKIAESSEIAGATKKWVVESFSQKERVVGIAGAGGCDSKCSDIESTTGLVLTRNRVRRGKHGGSGRG